MPTRSPLPDGTPQSIVLREYDFLLWMWNSAAVACISTLLAVVVGTMAAYSIARLRFAAVEGLGSRMSVGCREIEGAIARPRRLLARRGVAGDGNAVGHLANLFGKLSDDPAGAIEALRSALQKGFATADIDSDPEFTPLHGRADYKALLKEFAPKK
jgi:hypothetical protein